MAPDELVAPEHVSLSFVWKLGYGVFCMLLERGRISEYYLVK